MDNLDKKIKDSKSSIKESNINNPGSIYSKANIKKGNLKNTLFSKVMIFRYLTVLLLSLTVILSILLLNNNSVNNPNEDNNNINNPVEDEKNNNSNDLNNINLDGSVKFSDASEIRTLLMNSSNGNNNEDMEGGVVPDEPSEDSPSGGIDHEYETNNQVEGVDEADIVKVNGDYIYYVTQKITTYGYLDSVYVKRQFGQNALYILKANGDSLDIIKTVTFPSIPVSYMFSPIVTIFSLTVVFFSGKDSCNSSSNVFSGGVPYFSATYLPVHIISIISASDFSVFILSAFCACAIIPSSPSTIDIVTPANINNTIIVLMLFYDKVFNTLSLQFHFGYF